MKIYVALCFFVLQLSCSRAQTALPPAREWSAKITVLDEGQIPVPGANVIVGYYAHPSNHQSIAMETINGTTDTNGMFNVTHADYSALLEFSLSKSGYYPTFRQIALEDNPDKRKLALDMILRPIGQPIPMFAKRVETKIKKDGEPVGFDLSVGDWVEPYGLGKSTDMIFTAHRNVKGDRDYDAKLRLSFPNDGDGICVAPPEQETGSALTTPRTATQTGYAPTRLWHYTNSTGPEAASGYFIRVRTVLDQKGDVRSAMYGKIKGDFRFYVGTRAPQAGMGFDYYLNPNPNDRNVEFDPKQNLLKGEQVDKP